MNTWRTVKAINLDGSKLNTKVRRDKAQKVALELLRIFQSNMFRQLILGMNIRWRQGCSAGCGLKDLTNEQIYDLIMTGREEWNQLADYELDLLVDDFYKPTSTVGYMNPGRPQIFVNTKFFDSMSRRRCGSNFAHEYMHTLGARHSGPKYRESIPYYMNDVYEKCYRHLVEQGLPDSGGELKPSIVLPKPERKPKTFCERSWKTLWIKRCYTVVDP